MLKMVKKKNGLSWVWYAPIWLMLESAVWLLGFECNCLAAGIDLIKVKLGVVIVQEQGKLQDNGHISVSSIILDWGTDSWVPCMESWFSSLGINPASRLSSIMWRGFVTKPNWCSSQHTEPPGLPNHPPPCSEDLWWGRSYKERYDNRQLSSSFYLLWFWTKTLNI